MTLKEAYKTLGASKQDDDREIKAKYKISGSLFLIMPANVEMWIFGDD